jgi:DNA-binding MarR family transcriptional regulator
MPIRFGETHPSAKLNNQQVKDIRHLWEVGHRNIRVIARNYGVSQSNIKKIVLGETWKHLEETNEN